MAAAGFPTHSSVTPQIELFAQFGDEVQEGALQAFYQALARQPNTWPSGCRCCTARYFA